VRTNSSDCAARSGGQLVELEVAAEVLGRQPRQRREAVAGEDQRLVARKGQLDAVVGRTLGNQRLRRIERIDRELDPAAVLDQLLLD
jgi:hypothetical protein